MELKWVIGTTWTSSTENMKIATYTDQSKFTVQILWTFATLFFPFLIHSDTVNL